MTKTVTIAKFFLFFYLLICRIFYYFVKYCFYDLNKDFCINNLLKKLNFKKLYKQATF